MLVLVPCVFLAGVMRSPGPGGAAGPTCDRIPVVLRLELPFLTGQCRESVRAKVLEVRAGDPRLAGRYVVLRGLDLAGRRGQRRLLIAGTFYAPQPARNPMAHDSGAGQRRAGVAGSVRVREVLEEMRSPADGLLAAMRGAVRGLIAGLADERARGVIEAMLLGDRTDLPPDVKSVMLRAGAYHVLAISGLHVGILVFMVSILATILRLGRIFRAVVGLAIVVFYIIFTGMRPSAMRAGTLFLVLGLARLFQYKVDYPNAVCLAGAALLFAVPGLAWDLGFRLSFGAVFGMTLFIPLLVAAPSGPASVARRASGYVQTGLAAALAAQLLTVPFLVWSFGRVSIVAGLSNLVILPVMSLALTAGIEGAVLAGVLPALGSVFMRSASVLIAVAIAAAERLGAWGGAMVYAGRPHAAKVCLYYAAVLWLGLGGTRIGRRSRLALLLAAFALMLVRAPGPGDGRGRLEVTFLYVGNGDACVMELPDGRTVLIDTGPASADYDAARAVVLPFLALRGIGTLDMLIVTHPHNDHYGGIPALVETIRVGEILVATLDGEGRYVEDLDTARDRGVPVNVVRAGEKLAMGEVTLEVLHPGSPGGPGLDVSALPGEREDPNAWSMVIRATLNEHSLLMTGDLTPAVQESLVARETNLKCDVLKVPHHGHPGETSEAFARAVSADLAVISCGAKYFDMPDTATTALLERAGSRVLSTRADGAVRVVTDGRSMSVSTVLGGAQNASY